MSFYEVKTKYEIQLTQVIEAKDYDIANKVAKNLKYDLDYKVHNKICEIPFIQIKETSGSIIEVKERR